MRGASYLSGGILLALAAMLGIATPLQAAVTFTGVGYLDGTGTYKYSKVLAVSPDGTIAVGESKNSSNITEAFMYDIATGVMTGLGFPVDADQNYSSAASVGITSTGVIKIAVNCNVTIGTTTYKQAYLWSSDLNGGAGGYTTDFILLPNGFNSIARALAVQLDDEVMITGMADDATLAQHGFRYRTLPSMLDLAKPPTSAYPNNAWGISAFGDVGGYSSNCQVGGGNHRNAWTFDPDGSVYTWLDTLQGPPSNVVESQSKSQMSLDGLCVVGRSTTNSGVAGSWEPFRQISGRQADGYADVEGIGYLPGQNYGEAYAVNGYGTVIAGYSMTLGVSPSDRKFFVWDTINGMQDLATLIGGVPAGWTIGTAGDVTWLSQSGETLVGWANHDGNTEGWVVQGLSVPPPPPPKIQTVTPNPENVVAGASYTKKLTLTAGRLPVPTWAKLQGPAALPAPVPGGRGATISGWTPTAADIGSYTVEVEASSATGSDTEQWVLNVIPPPAPTVLPWLPTGGTEVTVSGIYSFATKVELYKNGTDLVATATAPPADFSSGTYKFTGLPPMVTGDFYQARQTTGGADSALSTIWRVVQPTEMSFFDDVEAAVIKRDWLRYELPLNTEQNHTPGGSQSFKETTIPSGTGIIAGANWADATPTDPDDLYRYPVLFEFWMYDVAPAPGDTTSKARHRGGLYQFDAGGWQPGVAAKYILETGCFDGLRSAPPGQVYDNQKYQGRVVITGTSTNTVFNLVDLAPNRSTGWHKFSIKAGANKCWFYVDGKRGAKVLNVSPSLLDAIRVGNESGSPDMQPAWFDDISVRKFTETDPYLELTDITAYEGVPIPPTDQKGLDADTPDTVKLVMTGTLPTGLVASATSVEVGSTPTSGPVAVITISGTPAAGTAGTYTLNFTATDDVAVSGRAATGSVTITVGLGCNTPPQDVDGDSDVDLTDFGTFQACFNGPNRPWPGPPINQRDCSCLDADKDADVDLADFGQFQVCFNGPNRPPTCP